MSFKASVMNGGDHLIRHGHPDWGASYFTFTSHLTSVDTQRVCAAAPQVGWEFVVKC